MDKIIAIVRTPDRLMALISRARYQFKLPLDEDGGTNTAQLKSFYEIAQQPLTAVTAKLCPQKERLLAAWGYLGNVRAFDAEILYQILIVLIETQTDPDADFVKLPALTPDLIRPPHKPTRAYLRAHKSMRYQLAKPKQPAVIDLRPYLCDEK